VNRGAASGSQDQSRVRLYKALPTEGKGTTASARGEVLSGAAAGRRRGSDYRGAERVGDEGRSRGPRGCFRLVRDVAAVAADIPDNVTRVVLKPDELPANWRQVHAPPGLAGIGNSFAAERKSAILVLPSALVPSESNWLINPLHSEFAKIEMLRPEPFQYDARFFA